MEIVSIGQFTGLFRNQNYHEQIRKQIYEYAFKNKENFINFILSDEGLTTEQYIEKIKLDKRFAGDLEISICSVLYQINIYVYSYRIAIEKMDINFIMHINHKVQMKIYI